MNRLSPERRTAVLKSLVEGNSILATCRITGTAKGTVLRLLAEIGEACARLHDENVRDIQASRVQCDEIWSYVAMKERNVSPEYRGRAEIGDVWTWVALDQDTKLCVSWLVGNRGPAAAAQFVGDLQSRLATRVQLTTDGHHAYAPAVENAFGWGGTDYAQLVKLYQSAPGPGYSPGRCVGARKEWMMGRPKVEDVSTSHVERQNLTMRMQMRRFTRLTNGFSKKVENHRYAVALHFAWYNWCRPHRTLTKAGGGIHTTPAMAAGLTNRVWKLDDLVSLIEPKKVGISN
jgi:IS1 family transposase